MHFEFSQAEQMLNGSYQQKFALKVSLKTKIRIILNAFHSFLMMIVICHLIVLMS